MRRICLVAGEGTFPLLFAERARTHGCEVIAIALSGLTSERIVPLVAKVHWIAIGQVGKLIRILLLERAREVVLAGRVPKALIHRPDVPRDARANGLVSGRQGKGTAVLITRVMDMLARIGVTVLDSTTFLEDQLAGEGVLNGLPVPERLMEDVRLGREVAREAARFDIGQTVVVKEKDVIAVEGVEGTDAALRRAYDLAGPGCVAVKVARPRQDMRFDVPTIGMGTVSVVEQTRMALLAVEARKTLMLDREQVIEGLRAARVPLVGVC